MSIPYFFAISDDKNFTFKKQILANENPLLVARVSSGI